MAHVHVCAQRSQLLVVLLELAEAPLAIRVFFCGTSSQVGFRRQTPSLPLKTSFRPSSGLDFNPRCHKLLEYFSAYILILFCLFFLTPQAGHGKPMSLTEHRGLFPSTQSLSPSWLREDCQSTGVPGLFLDSSSKNMNATNHLAIPLFIQMARLRGGLSCYVQICTWYLQIQQPENKEAIFISLCWPISGQIRRSRWFREA